MELCFFFLRPVNRLPREEKSEPTVLEISRLDWNRGCCFSDYVLTLCTSFDSVVCVSVKLQCFFQLTYAYQRSNKNNKIKDTRLFRSKRALQMFSEQETDFSDFISNQTSNQVAAVLHLSLEPGLHWATDYFFFPQYYSVFTQFKQKKGLFKPLQHSSTVTRLRGQRLDPTSDRPGKQLKIVSVFF